MLNLLTIIAELSQVELIISLLSLFKVQLTFMIIKLITYVVCSESG